MHNNTARFILSIVFCVFFLQISSSGDSIKVGGKVYKDVYIKEGSSFYDICDPSNGKVISVPKQRKDVHNLYISPDSERDRLLSLFEAKKEELKKNSQSTPSVQRTSRQRKYSYSTNIDYTNRSKHNYNIDSSKKQSEQELPMPDSRVDNYNQYTTQQQTVNTHKQNLNSSRKEPKVNEIHAVFWILMVCTCIVTGIVLAISRNGKRSGNIFTKDELANITMFCILMGVGFLAFVFPNNNRETKIQKANERDSAQEPEPMSAYDEAWYSLPLETRYKLTHPITMEHYAKIHIGMSYVDVLGIMPRSGDLIQSFTLPGMNRPEYYEVYEWANADGGFMHITIRDNYVKDKMQAGL